MSTQSRRMDFQNWLFGVGKPLFVAGGVEKSSQLNSLSLTRHVMDGGNDSIAARHKLTENDALLAYTP